MSRSRSRDRSRSVASRRSRVSPSERADASPARRGVHHLNCADGVLHVPVHNVYRCVIEFMRPDRVVELRGPGGVIRSSSADAVQRDDGTGADASTQPAAATVLYATHSHGLAMHQADGGVTVSSGVTVPGTGADASVAAIGGSAAGSSSAAGIYANQAAASGGSAAVSGSAAGVDAGSAAAPAGATVPMTPARGQMHNAGTGADALVAASGGSVAGSGSAAGVDANQVAASGGSAAGSAAGSGSAAGAGSGSAAAPAAPADSVTLAGSGSSGGEKEVRGGHNPLWVGD